MEKISFAFSPNPVKIGREYSVAENFPQRLQFRAGCGIMKAYFIMGGNGVFGLFPRNLRILPRKNEGGYDAFRYEISDRGRRGRTAGIGRRHHGRRRHDHYDRTVGGFFRSDFTDLYFLSVRQGCPAGAPGPGRKPPAPAPKAAVPASVPAPTAAAPAPAVEDGISDEVVAVIAAAVAAMSEGGKAYTLRSVSQVRGQRPVWAAAGLAENTRPF